MSLFDRNLAQLWVAAHVAQDMHISLDAALAVVIPIFSSLVPKETL